MSDISIRLAASPGDGGKYKVSAKLADVVLHVDELNPASAMARKRFVKALVEKVPETDAAAIDLDLLALASRPALAPSPCGSSELDASRVVRPELFITPHVTSLAVPVVQMMDNRPVGRWVQYLLWSDGRRERRELAATIELPDGERLFVHPIPGEPARNTVTGWSMESRRAWLDGAAAPNPAEVFRRLAERIAHFIDLPHDTAAGTTATLALWSMLTYCYSAWDALPYLYIGGPMRSGKTRVFELLTRLVYRPLTSSSLTGPALFRTLHERGGTLLYDEAERLKQPTPEASELLAMLLAGYKRGGQATRLEKVGDSFRPESFDVFGPKALACIAGLPPTLASRCITINMFRAGPDSDKPQRRIDAEPGAWQRLRDDLHGLGIGHGPTWLSLAQRTDLCPAGIGGRDFELWQPLLGLAWWIESEGAAGLLALMQRHALDAIDAGRDDAIPEADETLLEILTEATRDRQWLTPGEILTRAQDRAPAVFGKPNGNGPRWHANTVSKRFKAYGIPVPKKSNGQRRYREVTLEMLYRIQRHYGIDLGLADPILGKPTLADPTDPDDAAAKVNGRVSQGQ